MHDRIRVRDVELAVTVAGRGSGAAFVWAHMGGHSRAVEDEAGLFDWQPLCSMMKVVRYDARGHGRSGDSKSPEHFTYEGFGRDLVDLVGALRLRRYWLGGASLGAAAVLHAALERDCHPQGIVVVAPPRAWEQRPMLAASYLRQATDIEATGTMALRAAVALPPSSGVFAGSAELAPRRLDVGDEVMPMLMRGLAQTDLPSRRELVAIGVPTLVVSWKDDPSHPEDVAEGVALAVPGAALSSVETSEQLLALPRRIGVFISEHR